MTTLMMPICGVCTHLHRDETGKGLIPWRCDAYPRGIPREILMSRVDHRKPHAGDHAVLFDPRDKTAVASARHRKLGLTRLDTGGEFEARVRGMDRPC